MLKKGLGHDVMSRTQTFDWCSHFKSGQSWIEDA